MDGNGDAELRPETRPLRSSRGDFGDLTTGETDVSRNSLTVAITVNLVKQESGHEYDAAPGLHHHSNNVYASGTLQKWRHHDVDLQTFPTKRSTAISAGDYFLYAVTKTEDMVVTDISFDARRNGDGASQDYTISTNIAGVVTQAGTDFHLSQTGVDASGNASGLTTLTSSGLNLTVSSNTALEVRLFGWSAVSTWANPPITGGLHKRENLCSWTDDAGWPRTENSAVAGLNSDASLSGKSTDQTCSTEEQSLEFSATSEARQKGNVVIQSLLEGDHVARVDHVFVRGIHRQDRSAGIEENLALASGFQLNQTFATKAPLWLPAIFRIRQMMYCHPTSQAN